MKKSLFTILTVVALAAGAQAQDFTGTYDLSGGGNNVTSFGYNGTNIDHLNPSSLAKVGFTTSSSNDNFRGSAWPVGASDGSDTFTGSVDLGKYIEFTLAANTGYLVNMTSVTFGVGRSATGPRQWQWRSSVDGYATPIESYSNVQSALTLNTGVLTTPDSTSTTWTGNVLDLSGLAFQNLESVTFRLYGFNAEGNTGTGGLQGNLTFSGSIIPEPSALLLLSLAGAGFLARRRRAHS